MSDASPGEGYRWVEPGEILQRGDECKNNTDAWIATLYAGEQSTEFRTYRRKLPPKDEGKKCQRCGGDGYITVSAGPLVRNIQCPICHGTGFQPKQGKEGDATCQTQSYPTVSTQSQPRCNAAPTSNPEGAAKPMDHYECRNCGENWNIELGERCPRGCTYDDPNPVTSVCLSTPSPDPTGDAEKAEAWERVADLFDGSMPCRSAFLTAWDECTKSQRREIERRDVENSRLKQQIVSERQANINSDRIMENRYREQQNAFTQSEQMREGLVLHLKLSNDDRDTLCAEVERLNNVCSEWARGNEKLLIELQDAKACSKAFTPLQGEVERLKGELGDVRADYKVALQDGNRSREIIYGMVKYLEPNEGEHNIDAAKRARETIARLTSERDALAKIKPSLAPTCEDCNWTNSPSNLKINGIWMCHSCIQRKLQSLTAELSELRALAADACDALRNWNRVWTETECEHDDCQSAYIMADGVLAKAGEDIREPSALQPKGETK